MAQMAKGAEIIKGTFTAVKEAGNQFTLNIGKTLTEYLYLFRMTDTSYATLMSSGQTAARMYECVGHYPKYEHEQTPGTGNAFVSYRVNPSNGEFSSIASEAGSLTGSSITIPCNTYGNGANILYADHNYEYLIVSLENV